MTPPARTQAAIEILDQVVVAAREAGAAADTLVARYFAQRRYAGSKDRRAVRELVYAAIRRAGELPASGRAALVAVADEDAVLAATFDGSTHAAAPIAPDEARAPAGVAPRWLERLLAGSGVTGRALAALVGRAPLDLRVNALKVTREAALVDLPDGVPTPYAAMGVRLPTGTSVDALPLFNQGSVEVQDEGSQLVGIAAGARPGMRVVDLCAGGGGKTLALAADMANEGAILACDIDRGRLSRLLPRATRAGVGIVETRLLNPGTEAEALEDWRGTADLVVVDAPCSGTGTWRRNPEARWRLSPARLERLAATQAQVLAIAAPLVRPGGALVYIVCSLLDGEGAGRVDAFLAANAGWRAEPVGLAVGIPRGAGLRLDPASSGTDGFFVARLLAPC